MEKYIIIDTECFNLKYTLECGQCFRWKICEDDWYVGIIKDRVIKIKQDKNRLYVKSNDMKNLEYIIKEYLGLNKDYLEIEKRIVLVDDYINKALKNTSGLRILNQDFFETLISYIISANNNIPRISKSVNEISMHYGKKVEFEGDTYYLFPTAKALKDVSVEKYRECGVGFRDKYIYDTVKKINNGEFNLENINDVDTKILKSNLLELMGVGPKVADCILLFSCGRKEVFPIDVWVERVMKKLYFEDKKISKKKILEYANEHFGEDAGIIQQHLFYNIRENMI